MQNQVNLNFQNLTDQDIFNMGGSYQYPNNQTHYQTETTIEYEALEQNNFQIQNKNRHDYVEKINEQNKLLESWGYQCFERQNEFQTPYQPQLEEYKNMDKQYMQGDYAKENYQPHQEIRKNCGDMLSDMDNRTTLSNNDNLGEQIQNLTPINQVYGIDAVQDNHLNFLSPPLNPNAIQNNNPNIIITNMPVVNEIDMNSNFDLNNSNFGQFQQYQLKQRANDEVFQQNYQQYQQQYYPQQKHEEVYHHQYRNLDSKKGSTKIIIKKEEHSYQNDLEYLDCDMIAQQKQQQIQHKKTNHVLQPYPQSNTISNKCNKSKSQKDRINYLEQSYFTSNNLNQNSDYLTKRMNIKLLKRKQSTESTDSQRFRNMKKLVMNGILKYFVPEILDLLIGIPDSIRKEIIKIANIIREKGKFVSEKHKKMDLFSQPHFNALFLSLNKDSCEKMKKNTMNTDLHNQIYGADISKYKDLSERKIQEINDLKIFMYLIAKGFLIGDQKTQGEVIKTYEEIVLQSLQKMIMGEYINKFQSYKNVNKGMQL